MDGKIKELIKIFMSEAKKINDIRSGTKPELKYAVGLVEVCVAFEAFINDLKYTNDIKEKRCIFSSTYQHLWKEQIQVFSQQASLLKKELDRLPLEDMTPNTKRDPIFIRDINNLCEQIEVIYRIRSNLVHGSKTLTEERNKILIENSFFILYNLLEIVLKQEKID